MLVSRRHVCGGLAGSLVAAPFIGRTWAQGAVRFDSNPFSLGVASGDPDATSVVLWTRLAPKPLERDGGMPSAAVPVDWEIAEDDKMQKVVHRGRTEAVSAEGHSLRIVADGLQPNRPYWYRFMAAGAESPIGRTRTLPAPGTMPDRHRLAVAGCQRIEQGFFTAWDDIARSDLDLVFHYGDYIYEFDIPAEGFRARMGFDGEQHVRSKPTNLNEYRTRYALYKLDPDLQAAHAAHPFVVSFDDHEVVNNWGGLYLPNAKMRESDLLRLRTAAFQAFYENLPVRPAMRPRGSGITAYRAFDVGGLVRLAALDTRQYRALPACGKPEVEICAKRTAAGRSMIGAEQEKWLLDQFARKDATWTVLGNQVMMMQRRFKDGQKDIVNNDKWDGFADARRRLLEGAADRKVSGLVVVTGDYHRAFAGNLKVDFDKDSAPTVGVEFLASSISSSESEGGVSLKALRAANPHMRLVDSKRGWLACTFEQQRCQATFRTVETVDTRGAPVKALKTFEVDPKNVALG